MRFPQTSARCESDLRLLSMGSRRAKALHEGRVLPAGADGCDDVGSQLLRLTRVATGTPTGSPGSAAEHAVACCWRCLPSQRVSWIASADSVIEAACVDGKRC